MKNWIELLSDFKLKQEPVALITVTRCLGSTPCVLGSRMIITRDKTLHGTIGGGKLEFLAIEKAMIALDENKIIESGYTLGPEFEQCFDEKEIDPSVNQCEVSEIDFKTFREAVRWGKSCYVLVLTHNHAIDFDIISMALQNETKFLGLIGSKTKKARFNNMLINEMDIKEGMSNVVCPIGLPIGGDTPKEIAISVVAQLLQVHYQPVTK